MVSEVAKTKYLNSGRPEITYNADEHILSVIDPQEEDSSESRLEPAALRRDCQCAACVEELTGRQILIPTSVSDSVAPMRMVPTGNYALSVDWSDGHRSLYPYRQIRALLQQKKQGISTESKKTKSL